MNKETTKHEETRVVEGRPLGSIKYLYYFMFLHKLIHYLKVMIMYNNVRYRVIQNNSYVV